MRKVYTRLSSAKAFRCAALVPPRQCSSLRVNSARLAANWCVTPLRPTYRRLSIVWWDTRASSCLDFRSGDLVFQSSRVGARVIHQTRIHIDLVQYRNKPRWIADPFGFQFTVKIVEAFWDAEPVVLNRVLKIKYDCFL